MTKRKMVWAGALTACLALTACGSGGSSDAKNATAKITDPKVGVVKKDAYKGATLTFAGDGGTTQEGMAKAALEPFAKEAGIKLQQDSPQTLAKIQAQVKSNNVQWDWVTDADYLVQGYCGELFEPLDKSQLDLSKIPQGSDSKCGVPSISYGMILVYNTKKYGSNPPKDWADFFDTKKFPGKRGVYGASDPYPPVIEAASIAVGRDPGQPFTDADFDPAMAKLKSIRPDTAFWQTGAQAQQQLESGEVDMAALWTGRALAAAKNGADYTPVWNQWFLTNDQMAMVRHTKVPAAVYAGMNYYLGAEEQAKFTELTGYSPLNSDAKPQIDKLTQQYIVTTPEHLKTDTTVNLEYWGKVIATPKVVNGWQSLVTGQ